jgi:rhodanese-related sulfurtransferase
MKNATVHEALAKQEAGATYVDVRSVPEFAEGHPAGALNVPLLHRDARTGQMAPNTDFVAVMGANFSPDTVLLIGCQVGGRSAQAAQILSAAGYRNVTNVLGGFGGTHDPMTGATREGWLPAGLPVEPESAPGQSYQALLAKARGDR